MRRWTMSVLTVAGLLLAGCDRAIDGRATPAPTEPPPAGSAGTTNTPTSAARPPSPRRTAPTPAASTPGWTDAATATDGPPTTGPSTPSPVGAVPLVVCPTESALPDPQPHTIKQPSTVVLPVPASPQTAAALAVYTDTMGIMRIVAPRDWACAASYGTDGSGAVGAHPRGRALPPGWDGSGWHLPAGSTVEAVVGGQMGGCAGCAIDVACALFPSAAADGGRDMPCTATRPPGEHVVRLSATEVALQDPPGVAGTASPSGGVKPANAVMIYHSVIHDDDPGVWLGTCTLPATQKVICTVSLNAFLVAHRAR